MQLLWAKMCCLASTCTTQNSLTSGRYQHRHQQHVCFACCPLVCDSWQSRESPGMRVVLNPVAVCLQGLCTRPGCPYLHVALPPTAPICRAFLEGHCPKGASCPAKHYTPAMARAARAQATAAADARRRAQRDKEAAARQQQQGAARARVPGAAAAAAGSSGGGGSGLAGAAGDGSSQARGWGDGWKSCLFVLLTA